MTIFSNNILSRESLLQPLNLYEMLYVASKEERIQKFSEQHFMLSHVIVSDLYFFFWIRSLAEL